MTLLHLSDTHTHHHHLSHLPPATLLIHSGDMCHSGTASEMSNFLSWFLALDYKYKILLAGNHDTPLHQTNAQELLSLLPENTACLSHSGIEIEGVRFWGVPFTLKMQANYHEELSKIPPDIDVLVSHIPPYGILDCSGNTHFGCPHLLQTVLKIKPKIHLFGHTHSSYGIEKSKHTTFVNASVTNNACHLVNPPILLEI
jgi:Icc-related predicted phosphoesterase